MILGRRFQRTHLYAAIFLLLGLFLIFAASNRHEPGEVTRFSFGVGKQALRLDLPVGRTLLAIGVFYVLTALLVLSGVLKRIAIGFLILSAVLIFPTILVAAAAGKQTNVLTMLAESLRLATPIALGALAGIWSERAGVVNIAIEGMMLSGAAFGFTAFFFLGNAGMPNNQALFISVIVAVLVGGLMALLHGWLSITFRTDQIVSGTVINILAIGVTSFIRREYLLSTRAGRVTLPAIEIPVLSQIPIVGPVLFDNKPIFYSMFILLALTHFVLFYTVWGLRTRAVGEHPEAADTVGIDVIRVRYVNVVISGLIAGLAGAWFSLETVGGFDDLMTNGKGFIALAAMIFGKWTPIGSFGAAMLFGFAEALGTRFQILQVPIPSQFLQILPYVVTMIVLAGLIGRAVPPAADGKPYEKRA
ncbi:MAG TPA: ABC transporter permease [Chloroflexi bacterium]|nr:ABC transporter permease [Chloroflexota bacterium]